MANVLECPIGNNFQLGILQLSGVMLYPHNDTARDRFFASYLGDSFVLALDNGETFPEISSGTRLNLARASGIYGQARTDALKPAITSSTGNAMHGGVLAGAQFLITIAAAHRDNLPRGRSVADKLLDEWLRRAPRYFGKTKPRFLALNWRKYKEAVHIWATLHIIGQMPKTMDEYRAFVSVSERLRFLGELYESKHGDEPLLDSRTTCKAANGFPLIPVGLDFSGAEEFWERFDAPRRLNPPSK